MHIFITDMIYSLLVEGGGTGSMVIWTNRSDSTFIEVNCHILINLHYLQNNRQNEISELNQYVHLLQ